MSGGPGTPRCGGGGGGRRAAAESPAPRPLGASGTPTLAACPGNDDERERRQRRRSRATDLQLGSTDSPLGLVSPVPRQVDTSLPAVPQWTNTQISEHYSTCIKLSTENKITTKNAFGLHLIDYMTEILKQKDSELTNFKIAAGTLDASAKIYAVRVDAVHADAYKVLGGLGKDSAPTKDADSQEGGESTASPETGKRVQTKKKHTFKTIEQNLNNINMSEAHRRSEVDPMFQKTAASFDECSTAGIFLTGLRTHGCHSELLFDSKIVPLPSSETLALPNSAPVKVTDLKPLLAQCVEKRPICSSLAGFQFTQWDAESHDESVSALLDKFKKSDQVFDIHAEMASDDVEDDIPTLPNDDFHADSPNCTLADKIGEFTGSLKAFGTNCERKRTDAAPLGEGDIGTLCLHLSMQPGEYSYFSPRTLSMWAGPEHWRFKPRHKSDAVSEKETKKNAKKAFEINFDEDIDFEVYFRKTKAAVTLAKSILERNVRSTTLPTDFNYDPNNIVQLFLKPAVKLCRMAVPGSSMDHEDEIGEYDYNNPNDTSNFCPALQAADSDDDNDPAEFMGQTGEFNLTTHPASQEAELNEDVGGVDITTYGELNLIAEPQKVNKIAIQYAKTAKKMDMKRLKQNMWDLLIDGQKKQTVAEIENVEKETDKSAVAGEKVFSGITKELLHRLPSVMAKNLSVPLAFACLLHLANEKNLKLEGTEDLSDVLVKQGD